MSFIDARTLARSSALDTGICIAGAGAAGITLALRLASQGRDVCLVESGGFTPDAATQSLYDLECTGHPVRANYMSRARYFGGTCNLWAGRNMVLGEADFLQRPWVPDSGWPIPYAELSAFYPEAERRLALPSFEAMDRPGIDRRYSAAERALFATGDLVPAVSLWGRSSMRFGSANRGQFRRSARIRVLLHASVTGIGLGESGEAVESLTLSTLCGRQVTLRARVFVLACGGLENARLLLQPTAHHPRGVGNRHDVVGRYYMDHPRAVFGKAHFNPASTLALLRGRPLRNGKLQIGIGLSAERQREERLLNHYMTFEAQASGYSEARYQAFVQTMKVALRRGYAGSRWDFAKASAARIPEMIYLLSPKELMPHSLYRLYVLGRDIFPRRASARTFVAVYFCEQPPDPGSRVTLGRERDALGLHRLELHWRIDESVTRTIQRMQQVLAERLTQNRLGYLEPGEGEPAFTDASHHMGTTRMSDSPLRGVVDRDCRVHGVANLYIAGSSVFPAAGHANPTLTIVALALRLAEHLRSRWND